MNKHSRRIIFADIPMIHSYDEVWDLQKHLQSNLIRSKRSGAILTAGYLILCEHSPVITIGKSGKGEHLTSSEQELRQENIEFYRINRGGDITFHGPGQITGYPIFDLDQFYNDVHRYVRELEEVIIQTLNYFGLHGERVEGYTGVWINDIKGRRKIAAIGVHMSRWVSMHGFALNVSTDLNYFNRIIPCGISDSDTSVTSIVNELQTAISMEEVKEVIKLKFSEVFGFCYLDPQN